MKRIFLFIATNILVILTVSITVNLLGLQPYLTAKGINYQALAIFCLVWGMAGSFISLALSRFMAKMMMGVKVVDPQRPGEFSDLVQDIKEICRSAGLEKLPEIGVYQSPELNAFATGPSKSRSLVAVSTGLLNSMNRSQIRGVLAHEVAHIVNGDMVTMTLLQGIMNAIVMFLARVIAFAASQGVKEESQPMVRMLITIVLDILLGILGSLVVFWFSRQREFRADAGSASYVGKDSMISALEALKRNFGMPKVEEAASIATMKISHGRKSGFMSMFSTHPDLDERISRLRELRA